MQPGHAVLVYTDEFLQYDWAPHHPLRPERLVNTVTCLRELGLLNETHCHTPHPAADEDIAQCHSAEYLAVVKALSAGRTVADYHRYGFSLPDTGGDNPIFPGMYEAMALVVGGSLAAVDLVLDDPSCIAFNLGGGLHHARRDCASGFCVFNDPAIAIERIRRPRPEWRVAYLDIDAHHGDGVQWLFYDQPDVLTVSLHQSGRTLFPGTGEVAECGEGPGTGYAVNVPLWPGTDDETYLRAFDAVVPPLLEAYQPDIVVAQLGCDAHFADPLTMLHLSVQGYAAVVRRIIEVAPRLVALGGGGYARTTVPRAWTLAFAAMRGDEPEDALPPRAAAVVGLSTLRDPEVPPRSPEQAAHAREWADAVVAQLRADVFPLHGL